MHNQPVAAVPQGGQQYTQAQFQNLMAAAAAAQAQAQGEQVQPPSPVGSLTPDQVAMFLNDPTIGPLLRQAQQNPGQGVVKQEPTKEQQTYARLLRLAGRGIDADAFLLGKPQEDSILNRVNAQMDRAMTWKGFMVGIIAVGALVFIYHYFVAPTFDWPGVNDFFPKQPSRNKSH